MDAVSQVGDVAEARLRDMADVYTPFAVRAIVTLGLPDLLADGPRPASELADAVGADPGALYRVMRYLAGKGFFVEGDDGVFSLAPPGRVVCRDHPSGLYHYYLLTPLAERMNAAMANMLVTLRTGRPAFDVLFGTTFREHAAADADAGAEFNALLAARAQRIGREAATMFDWAGIRTLVDVGGGNATILVEILQQHPELSATLVELPSVCAEATNVVEAAGLAGRVDIVPADFFTDPLPAGHDAYLLSSVLIGRRDDEAIEILRRCRSAMAPRSTTLVLERVLPDVGGGDDLAKAQDVQMLVVFGGQERRTDEFVALFDAAGLRLRSDVSLPSGRHVMCLRAEA